MGNYAILRDIELEGGVPARPGLTIINTGRDRSLHAAFRSIKAAAGSGSLDCLFVLCHGFSGENLRTQQSIDAGGEGLLIGREELLHSNVSMWQAINGAVNQIVIYACAAANTEPGNEYTDADGMRLMAELATYSGAQVYAADRIQWYNTHNNADNGRYIFGSWEGSLYEFNPGTTATRRVPRAPVELSEVFGGTAP